MDAFPHDTARDGPIPRRAPATAPGRRREAARFAQPRQAPRVAGFRSARCSSAYLHAPATDPSVPVADRLFAPCFAHPHGGPRAMAAAGTGHAFRDR
jgi:hypothetical protein